MQVLYSEYFVLAKQYPGWSLGEIKGMTARERKYWLAIDKWVREKEQA